MLASSREPCCTGRSPGGINPSPTNLPKCPAKPDGRKTTRATVGRDALIPPHPAAAQTPAGGYGIRPYGRRRIPRPTGKPRPPVTTNLCRGRCSHCARRRVSEANRAAGPALRPEIVPGTPRWRKVSREGHGPPLQPTENDRPNRTAATTQATVGRDALIPPHPRGGANARGRIWNPPLRTTANAAANRETAAPRYNKPL